MNTTTTFVHNTLKNQLCIYVAFSKSVYFKKNIKLYYEAAPTFEDLIVENLIMGMDLSPQVMVTSLSLLYSMHKSAEWSRTKKSELGWYHMVVCALMLANKINDDSSYTVNAWVKLSTITKDTLKVLERDMLRFLDFNVTYLRAEKYQVWCRHVSHVIKRNSLLGRTVAPVVAPAVPSTPVTPVTQPVNIAMITPPVSPRKRVMEEEYSQAKRVCNYGYNTVWVPVMVPVQPFGLYDHTFMNYSM